MYLRIACPQFWLEQMSSSRRINVCCCCCGSVIPAGLAHPLPPASLLLSRPPGSPKARILSDDKANVQKSWRDSERKREKQGEGGWVWQHICGIRLVLATGEKLLIQLVAAKALLPLSSSLSQNPLLTQPLFIPVTHNINRTFYLIPDLCPSSCASSGCHCELQSAQNRLVWLEINVCKMNPPVCEYLQKLYRKYYS